MFITTETGILSPRERSKQYVKRGVMKAKMFRIILAAGLLTCLSLAGCGSHHSKSAPQPQPDTTSGSPDSTGGIKPPPFRPVMIVLKNTNHCIAPQGGVQYGAALRLSSCEPTDLNCKWLYNSSNRMLVSAANQELAINAWNGATDGGELRLHNGCTPSNPDCTWTWKNGMLVSDKNPHLAIRADGALLRLSHMCSPTKPECMWSQRER